MGMDIGVLGTGRMGAGLGRAWAAAGHAVTLGSRDPDALRGRLGDAPAGLRMASHAQAAACAVVVLTTPFRVTADLVRLHAGALAGKVLVDITNPFGAAPRGEAGVAVHARALGAPARWAAAFKTNFAETVARADGVERQCLIAADDADAVATAAQLARAAGFAPLHCGGLDQALVLDLMVPLLIALDARHGGTHASHWRFAAGDAAP